MPVAPRNAAPASRRRPRAALGGIALGAALVVAACGSSQTAGPGGSADSGSAAPTSGSATSAAPTTGATTGTVATPTAASAAAIPGVPARITSAGTIKVGSEVVYPPMEYVGTDGKTPTGFDIDLFTAVAAKLGVKASYENTKFDSILIGVQSGKYDVGVSSFTVTKERLGSVNLVSYLSVGTQWAAKAGNPKGISPVDACGHKVAVQTSTTQETDLKARSAACTKAGKAAIDILAEQDGQLPFNDIITNKADAALSDLVVVADVIGKTNGQVQTVGDSYATAPFGFAVAKKDTALATALATAVNQVIADGTYGQLASKYKVENAAITKAEVNPAVTG